MIKVKENSVMLCEMCICQRKIKGIWGDVKLTHCRMITLALKLCKASSGEENLQHIHGPVIMYHCVSYLGSASIVL